MFVHTPGETANPSSTLFFPLSDEASQEVSCFVKLNSVLLSDTKRDLVEKILQGQSLNTGHQSCLKSKMPPLTVTRGLGSTDAHCSGQSCESSIVKADPATPSSEQQTHTCALQQTRGTAEVFHAASMKTNTSRFHCWLTMGS